MTLYVIIEHYPGEGCSEPFGVYSTREKAEVYKKYLVAQTYVQEKHTTIEEYVLDQTDSEVDAA